MKVIIELAVTVDPDACHVESLVSDAISDMQCMDGVESVEGSIHQLLPDDAVIKKGDECTGPWRKCNDAGSYVRSHYQKKELLYRRKL